MLTIWVLVEYIHFIIVRIPRSFHQFPTCIRFTDEIVFLHSGDELYPQEPDREGKNPPISIECSLSELPTKFPVMNRMLLKGPHSVNTSSGDGQVIPIFDHETLSETPSSKL